MVDATSPGLLSFASLIAGAGAGLLVAFFLFPPAGLNACIAAAQANATYTGFPVNYNGCFTSSVNQWITYWTLGGAAAGFLVSLSQGKVKRTWTRAELRKI
jgi:hypothetical protein